MTLALLLLATIPPDLVTRESVDLIEVNHFYDERGRLVFDQVIFYDWAPEHSRYQVIAWRLIKCRSQLPTRDWHRGGHVAVWSDGEVMRSVRAASVRETWTQFDVELEERTVLPKEKRRELIRPEPGD